MRTPYSEFRVGEKIASLRETPFSVTLSSVTQRDPGLVAHTGPGCRHGRDHKLAVWKISSKDEAALSRALPLDSNAPSRPQPWLLHLIEVNTMNFCTFASCPPLVPAESTEPAELLIAVPNTLASESVSLAYSPLISFSLPNIRPYRVANSRLLFSISID